MKGLLSMLHALTVCALCEPASSHENYPYACCGGNDCAPVTTLYTLDNGDMFVSITVNNQIRYTIFPKGTQSLPSPDGQNHACIVESGFNDLTRIKTYRPACLFLKGDF